MDLTNASALVTGGAGGFGSATARRLAQKGARVETAEIETTTLSPPEDISFPDDVIGVPIDIGDASVTVVWLYPTRPAKPATD